MKWKEGNHEYWVINSNQLLEKMSNLSNCVLSIILITIFIYVWSLDYPNARTMVFFKHGVDRLDLFSNLVGQQDNVGFIEKGHQKESTESGKVNSEFDHDFHENIEYLKSRLLIEHERKQPSQNSLVFTTTGASLFVVAILIIYCAKGSEEPEEEIEDDQSDNDLSESQSEKIEIVEANDLEEGGSSFRNPSIKLDNSNNLVEVGPKEPKDECSSNVPPCSMTPQVAPSPPPPKARPPPAPPIKGGRAPPPPPPKGSNQRIRHSSNGSDSSEYNKNRTKLKPFFWDKVLASPEHTMVWDEIKAGSFQFNEEMIESLFGYNPDEKKNNDRRGKQPTSSTTFIQIIDSKKAQNLSILLKALNVTTEEVHDALLEGQELPPELLETLIRMAPTSEEELKLRLFSGSISQIGPSERFLKALVEIPFAFKRMECFLFMMTLKEEASRIKDAFTTLEMASNTLRTSRLFLKILEAVLKTGNRMNDGTYRGGAQAFKLDTLLKLADVKGTDGKTTLLHFVVQEIIRTEGLKVARAANISPDYVVDDIRNLGLMVVSNLGNELEVIKKAAIIDSDSLTSTVSKLGQSMLKTKNFLNKEMQDLGEESRFHSVLKDFVAESETEITHLLEEERRIMDLVKKTIDYFHGNSSKEEGLRLFVIVRDFCVLLDKICAEIKKKMDQEEKTIKKEKLAKTTSQDSTSSTTSVTNKEQKLPPTTSEHSSEDHDSCSENEISSIARRFCANLKAMKESDHLIEGNTVLPILRTYSVKEKLTGKEENDFSLLLRTYSTKEKSMEEDNDASLRSQACPTKVTQMNEDNKLLPILRTYSNKEKSRKEESDFTLLLRTYSDKVSSMSHTCCPSETNASQEYNKVLTIPQASMEEKVIEPAFEALDEQGTKVEDLMELSSQEPILESCANGQQKETNFQENAIEEMRKKLFPLIQGSQHDELSSSSSDDDDDGDNDELQTSTKEILSNLPSQRLRSRSRKSFQESNTQTSYKDEQIKHMSTQEKVIKERQEKLFKIIQDRQYDDSSSGSSGDEM